MERLLVTFIVGLLIGAFLGVVFSSMLSVRRTEPRCLGSKINSINLISNIPVEKNKSEINQKVI